MTAVPGVSAAPASAPAPALAPAGLGPGSGTRDRLIEATERCLRRSGIRRTTMTEIAHEAGVSRAWLYRHFPDKPSIIVTTLSRTDERFWAEAHARVSAADGLAAQVAAAVQFSREHEPGALLLQLKAREPAAYAETVGTGLRQMMPGMAVFWHPYLRAARDQAEVRPDLDVARAAEWVMRMVLSLVTVPGDAVDADDPAAVRRFVDEFLVTGLR